MTSHSEFVESLHDVFSLFGEIEAKRMFGGYGVYHDGLMFALVADDELYLKADQESVSAFTELGLPPFVYEKNGKQATMSYYAAPEQLFDDQQQAKAWADQAHQAAQRAKKPKNKARPKKG